MPDLGNYDLVAALRARGCALCRVLSAAEVRAMDAFIHERGQAAESLSIFCERGGFCHSHAWLFHRRCALSLTGAPVAEMYEALLRRDIAHLEKLELTLADRRGRNAGGGLLGRRVCAMCERGEERLHAKASGFVTALSEPAVCAAYRESDGLCVQHLDLVGAAALAGDKGVAAFLIHDLRSRLERFEWRLSEYDRKRDYRYAEERTAADGEAWTDVVRSYVGDQYADSG
jgi:hypothetical protein